MLEFDERLQTIICHSLIDITQSGVTGTYKNSTLALKDWEYSRNQQRNYESIVQCIGLRAQPLELTHTVLTEINVIERKFGSEFAGVHNVWSFTFAIEHYSVFDKDDKQFLYLNETLHEVPCILGLTETIKPSEAKFSTAGQNQNIYFEYVEIHQ